MRNSVVNNSVTLSKPANRAAMRKFENKQQDKEIEALIDVERRTIVFEKQNSEQSFEAENVDLNHPLHKITWYQDTSIEDIESAIDEVVEIMEEIQLRGI